MLRDPDLVARASATLNRSRSSRLIPQPVQTKWLVLASDVHGRYSSRRAQRRDSRKLPAVAALSLLGCVWWTIGIMRWFTRSPVGSSSPGAAATAGVPRPRLPCVSRRWLGARPQPWRWRSALAALVVPTACVCRQSEHRRTAARNHARATTPARIPRPAVSVTPALDARPCWTRLGGSGLLNADQIGKAQLVLLAMMLLPWCAVLAAMFAGSEPAADAWCLYVIFGPEGRSLTLTPATCASSSPRRLSPARQRFVGGVFVLLPTRSACARDRVSVSSVGNWIDSGDCTAGAPVRGAASQREEEIRYLRDALGATFLPETWPAGGLPLRALGQASSTVVSWIVFSETALLTLTVAVRAGSLSSTVRPARTSLWPMLSIVLCLAVFRHHVLRMSFDISSIRYLPVPPLWFAALLATICDCRMVTEGARDADAAARAS